METFFILWLFLLGLYLGNMFTRKHYESKQKELDDQNQRNEIASLKKEIEEIKNKNINI
jgi:hypothetical protein